MYAFKRPKFPNIPVSLVSDLHNSVPAVHIPTMLQYPNFELTFGDFASASLGVSFGMMFRNSSGTNHREKMFRKAPLGSYLAQY